MKVYKIKCLDCNINFLADANRHHMDCCPTKGCTNAIDLEEWYHRIIGNIKIIEVFDPPWFEEEDDYHSALMTFLNDGDDEYTLEKLDNILYIINMR